MFAADRQVVLYVHMGLQQHWPRHVATVVLQTTQRSAWLESSDSQVVRQALGQLRALLPRLKPRKFALDSTERSKPVVHLYADAFVTLHGVRRTANKWLQDLPPLQELSQSTNGFGALVAISGRQPVGFRGEVPVEVLADLASSRAHIFWLEALAQVLSLAAVAHVCCWVDNTAAEHALNKGYSKDLRLSAIIGAFWVWAASRSLAVSFHRVSNSENISDGISRGDLQELPSVGGAFHEVSFKEVWPILQEFEADYKNCETEFAQLVASLSSQLH